MQGYSPFRPYSKSQGSSVLGELPVVHGQKLGLVPQWGEQRLVGAGQPGLAVEPPQRTEQCRTPARIEMCGNFVEQQQWRLAAHRLLQPRMSEDDRNKQRLLLAGRGQFGGNSSLGQTDMQVGAMRADQGAAGLRIALPIGGERRGE